jgi:hypothetical protein
MFLPFDTSAFSNTLNTVDRSAQRKALVAPFKEEFDGNSANILLPSLLSGVKKPVLSKILPTLSMRILLLLLLI